MTTTPSAGEAERLMRAALDQARAGMDAGEAPIGCVIALPSRDGETYEIIGQGWNRSNALQRKTAHAEIIAFEDAGGSGDGKPGRLPLDAKDAVLVSTLEPCVMCLGAAMEAGIATVLFGLEAPADNGTRRVRPPESPESSRPEIRGGILAGESRALFEEWLRRHGSDGEQAKFIRQLLALTDEGAPGR